MMFLKITQKPHLSFVTGTVPVDGPAPLEKPSHLAKSQVTSAADMKITWVALTSLFVSCIFLNHYM